jgi:uncharacterized glyoxalase superfamily protein PhnB
VAYYRRERDDRTTGPLSERCCASHLLYVDGASDGIAFYKRVFGAVELLRITRPDGKILHAEISICGSVVMIGDPDDGANMQADPGRMA